MVAGDALAGRVRTALFWAGAHQFIMAKHLSQLTVRSGQWQTCPSMHATIFLFYHPANRRAALKRCSEAEAIGFTMVAQDILDLAATGLHTENLTQTGTSDSKPPGAEAIELHNGDTGEHGAELAGIH